MAIALDSTTPAFVSASADTVTTASFTPPSGSYIFAVAWHDTASGNTTNTSVITGGGLTWTILRTRNKADAGGQNGHLQVSYAFVASSAAMTVTTTGTNTSGFCALRALVFTGVDTSTPVDVSDEGSNTSNVVSMTLTTVTDNAWAWIANIDWNAAAIPTANTGVTTDTGIRPGAPNFTSWVAFRTAVTSPAGSVTVSSTAPSTGNVNNFIAWALKPAAGSSSTPSGTDTFTLSESATVQNTLGGATDSGTLSESATINGQIAGSDSATLSESVTVVVSLSATDSATFSESASQALGTLNVAASDSFVLSEVTSNPNPSGRTMAFTLTYHLNRLAGTLLNGVPSQSEVRAANIWAGTTGLSLEDALNERAGSSVPKWDVAGALNAIAGTTGLTAIDAISRIP